MKTQDKVGFSGVATSPFGQMHVSKNDDITVTFAMHTTEGEVSVTLNLCQALALGSLLVEASARSVLYAVEDAQGALVNNRQDLARQALKRTRRE